MMPALDAITPEGEAISVVDAPTLLTAAGLPDVTSAEILDLAVFDDRAGELVGIVKEARGLVSDELVRRLDQRGKWTLHESDWTITSSSPEAGTVAYDTQLLRDALKGLLDGGVISREGADAALEEIHPPAAVPYDLLREVAAALRGELDLPAEDRLAHAIDGLLASEPEPQWRQRPAGIKALLKIPAAKTAIEACRVDVDPPRRVAKVKRTAKAAG